MWEKNKIDDSVRMRPSMTMVWSIQRNVLQDPKLLFLFYNKWQREWDAQTENKLKEIKPYITTWSTFNPRKIDVILTRLRIGYTILTHRHLLLAKDEPTYPHCHSSVLTIRHLLIDCVGLRHMYRHYFHSSSPSLTYLISEKPHHELLNFLKDASFYHEI